MPWNIFRFIPLIAGLKNPAKLLENGIRANGQDVGGIAYLSFCLTPRI